MHGKVIATNSRNDQTIEFFVAKSHWVAHYFVGAVERDSYHRTRSIVISEIVVRYVRTNQIRFLSTRHNIVRCFYIILKLFGYNAIHLN